MKTIRIRVTRRYKDLCENCDITVGQALKQNLATEELQERQVPNQKQLI